MQECLSLDHILQLIVLKTYLSHTLNIELQVINRTS